MPEFYVIGLLLVLLACSFVLFPVLLHRGGNAVRRRHTVNIDLFRGRLIELEQDCDSGLINADEFNQLKMELERRLLEDTEGDEVLVTTSSHEQNYAVPGKPPKKVLAAIALFIPLISYLMYQQIGARQDWDITQTLENLRLTSAAGQDTDESIDLLVKQLDSRLQQRPGNPDYLMTLANVHMERQNYPAAAAAYQGLSAQFPQDASILGRYAQALYLAANRSLNLKITAIAEQALAIDPNQSAVLGMLGIAGFENKDFPSAIKYWSRLLMTLTPNSPNRQMIAQGIEQAKKLLLESGGQLDVGLESVASVSQNRSDSNTGVEPAQIVVQVKLDSTIKVSPETDVFVFAKAVKGPPMPLAVARLKVADLPTSITLNDSMAMTPTMKISSFEQVNVVARVSFKGTAMKSPGDIEGASGAINVNGASGPVTIVISTIVD